MKACGLPPPTWLEHSQQQDPPVRGLPLPISVSLWVGFSLQVDLGSGARAGRWGGVSFQFRPSGGEMASVVIQRSHPVQPDVMEPCSSS